MCMVRVGRALALWESEDQWAHEGLYGHGICWDSVCGSRLKDGDREALERSGCSDRCCLLSSLDGEVVGSLALWLPSCGYRTGKRGQEGFWGDPPDAQGCVSTSHSSKETQGCEDLLWQKRGSRLLLQYFNHFVRCPKNAAFTDHLLCAASSLS